MSGWRNFGIELTEEARRRLVAVRLAGKKEMEIRNIDGFFVSIIPGYGDPPERPDPLLLEVLRKTPARGYYVLANDTTDTAEGLVRFRKGGPLVDVTDLVDPEIETGDPGLELEQTVFDGEGSRLPEYQMGAPGHWTVYKLLGRERFPFLDPY